MLHTTFVLYWVDSAATLIWVVSPTGDVTATRAPISAAELEQRIGNATGQIAGRGPVLLGSRAALRPWRELYDILIRPIRGVLPTELGSRVTIVPHGPLFELSFAGLLDDQNRYLVESYAIHYVPAVAVLRYATRDDETRAADGALLVGDPGALPVEPGDVVLAPLPWAKREVDAVRTLVSGSLVVLAGELASKARVRDSMAGRAVIHVASHAIVRRDETLSSYLALHSDGGSTRDEGRLTADDVYGLTLTADLVVLSGCRTALGPIGGDGVMGFTRAFLSAGASSVVATMWDVPDRTTYEVMKAFYAGRKRGRDKVTALREAQLDVLNRLRKGRVMDDARPLPEAPQLWAGIALVGAP